MAPISTSGARRCRVRRSWCCWRRRPTRCWRWSTCRAVADLAHAAGAIVVVDNVFATPLLQQPLQFGADVVVYSCTKHIDGQGRVLGGAVLGRQEMGRRDAAALHPQHRPHAVAVQRLAAAEGAGDAGAARRRRPAAAPPRSPISWPTQPASRASGIRPAPTIRSTRWRWRRCPAAARWSPSRWPAARRRRSACMNALRLIARLQQSRRLQVAGHASGDHHAYAHRRRGTRAARHHRRRDPPLGRAGGCRGPEGRSGAGAGASAARQAASGGD